MYNITEYLLDDEMLKLIALGSVEGNYVALEVSKTEAPTDKGYSATACVYDEHDQVQESFFPTHIYDAPYIPYHLTHIIRAELESRDMSVVNGVCATTYDTEYEAVVDFLCSDSNTHSSLCKSLKYTEETLH